MRNFFLIIGIILCSLQQVSCQEDGVVSFRLPIRNSLKFNRYLINPAFSFVREQSSYISFYTKRQWAQFDNAPQTYLFGYSGRITENQGVSLGLFQQNYGVLTTFGGVANFAQNIMFDEDSNLTFGLNIGFYKSGINKGKVITNYPDQSLDNIPSNSLLTINPGINYGTAFLDFGVSVNNLILYNLKTSQTIADDPEKSIEAHIMHTGYLDTYGFFDKSKFSALVKSEFKKDKTIISGQMLFSIPNGVWAQAGYNSVYGISAGLGLNISNKISVEYNFEKGTGNLSHFGPSHEIVFAYKFKNKTFDYGDDDDEGSIIPAANNRKYVAVKSKQSKVIPAKNDQNLKAEQEAKRQEKLKQMAAAKAKADSLAKVKQLAETKTKTETLIQAKQAATTKLRENANAKADSILKARQKAYAEIKAKAKAKNDSILKARQNALTATKTNAKPVVISTQTKITTDEKAKADALAKTKLAAEEKAKADALAKTKLAADEKAKADALAKAKLAAEEKVKADALAKTKLAADEKAKADALTKTKLAAEEKVKADALAKTKLAADEKAKADALAKAKLDAEEKVKADALAKAKLAADEKVKADALAKAKLAADEKAKAKLDALAKAKLAAEEKAKADALAKAKLAADEKAKADALAKAKLAAEEKAKTDADALAKAKLAADEKAKTDADALAKAKLAAEEKAKADALAKAKPLTPQNDENAKSMDNLAQSIKDIKNNQENLLKRFNETVAIKDKDLKDLKEENDLSEKGIFKSPKPFKSVSAENRALESLKAELEQVSNSQKEKISELERIYLLRLKKVSDKTDEYNQFYRETLDRLKREQLEVGQSIINLNASLEKINSETEIEKKRRIKRASFENDQERYTKDRATLNQIKEKTPFSATPLKAEDFDYGEEQSSMQIVKNVKHTENGYYLILAVHSDVSKRDQFLTKTIASGQSNIDFFYDVNTSKYFIYYQKFNTIDEAKNALKNKDNKLYNAKSSIVKIENN